MQWKKHQSVEYLGLLIITVIQFLDITPLIGDHAETLNDHYLRDIPAGDGEMNKIWEFVKEKQKSSNK